MIGKRRADHKKRMDEGIKQLASLSERAAEINDSNFTEEEMVIELEKIHNKYPKENNNYKNAINAIHTYNRVIRRTRDEVISRENSEEREITVNPEPEQKSQNDISKDLLQYEEPLQPTITNSEEKLREKRRGNVKVEPPKKSRHSKKYYRNKAGYSSKAKGGRKPKGKART